MPNQPDPRKSVKKVYDDGIAEVFRIITSLDATRAQVRVAKQTAKDLTSLLIAHTLESIDGRTALLSSLIVELQSVIASIETNPPYADALSKLTGVVDKARKLFSDEMKHLA